MNVTSHHDALSGLWCGPGCGPCTTRMCPRGSTKAAATGWVLQRRRRRAARAAAEAAEDAAALAASSGSAATDADLFGGAASGGGGGGGLGTRRGARTAPSRGASGGVHKRRYQPRQTASK